MLLCSGSVTSDLLSPTHRCGDLHRLPPDGKPHRFSFSGERQDHQTVEEWLLGCTRSTEPERERNPSNIQQEEDGWMWSQEVPEVPDQRRTVVCCKSKVVAPVSNTDFWNDVSDWLCFIHVCWWKLLTTAQRCIQSHWRSKHSLCVTDTDHHMVHLFYDSSSSWLRSSDSCTFFSSSWSLCAVLFFPQTMIFFLWWFRWFLTNVTVLLTGNWTRLC